MPKRICPYFGIALIMGALFVFMVFVLALPVLAQSDMPTTEVEATTTSETSLSDHFASAVEVEESSSVEGILPAKGSDFFKIPLNAGYQVKVYGNADYESQGGNVNWLEINLYQAGGNLLSTDHQEADGVKTAESFYYKGVTADGTESPEMVYIEVKNRVVSDNNENTLNYQVNFERIDRSDAFANTDAGDDFTTALDLQLTDGQANFAKNFLGVNACGNSKYCSTDESDYYMLSLAAGDALRFGVTPGAEMNVDLTLYDESHSEMMMEQSENAGAITSLEYTSETAQAVYIAVLSTNFSSYAMDISVVKGTAVTTSPTASPTAASTVTASPEKTPVSDASKKVFNIWDYKWYLIGGGVAVIVIIVIVIMMSRRKKKPDSSQQAEIEQLRTKMRGSKAAGATGAAAAPKIGAARTMHSDMKNVPAAPPKPGISKAAAPSSPKAPLPPAPAAPGKPAPGGLPKAPPRPTTPPARPAGAPPSGLPKPPPPPGPAPAGPRRVPEPPKPAGPPAPASSKPATPKPPASPRSAGGTPPGQVGKPGEMSTKAKQDIDDIFGS
ncbi:GGIII-like transmembrane region-containing protein [Patescibacteria group bacterium]